MIEKYARGIVHMRKRNWALMMTAIIIFIAAGCSIPRDSADVGKEIEEYGFVFTIPQGVKANEMDGDIYDLDFGITGKMEAVISIYPPAASEEMISEGMNIEVLEDMFADLFNQGFENIENETIEMRIVDGHQAGYIGLNCTLSDVPVYWQIYMLHFDESIFTFTIQIYTDRVTEDTVNVIDDFITEIRFAG